MDKQDYRRAIDSDVWHWHPKCPKWPIHTFECTRTRPVTGKHCQACGDQRAAI